MKSEYERDIVRSEILQGLKQVDETFELDEFETDFDRANRHLTVTFKAHTQNGETVEVKKIWE